MVEAKVHVNVEGASVDERERGVAAAHAAFESAGVTAVEAAAAAFKRGHIDYSLPPDPSLDDVARGVMTPFEEKAADAWLKAQQAAADACRRMARPPPKADLDLDFDLEESHAEEPRATG